MYVAFLTAIALSTAVPAAPRAHSNVGSSTHMAAAEQQGARLTLRFRDLDIDNDGVITRSEWRGSLAAFRTYDRNDDGVVTRAEFRDQNAGEGRVDEFDYVDSNNDGRIERREWSGNNTEFNLADRNRDGVLSRWEFDAADTQDTRAGLPGVRGRAAGVHEVVRVDARQGWNDTGVFVRAGDTVTIYADGTIQLSDNPSDVSDPGGARSGRLAPNAPIANAPAGALIARIGGSAPILVGANGRIDSAPATGRLLLGVNDDHFPDNMGEFRATVDVIGR